MSKTYKRQGGNIRYEDNKEEMMIWGRRQDERKPEGIFFSGPISNQLGCVGLEAALSKESTDPILGSIRAALF